MMKNQCEVPECEGQVEFDSPGNWCIVHWNIWWNWPEDKPEPNWMPEITNGL